MPFRKVQRRRKLDSLKLCAQGNETKDVAQAIGISESTIYRSKRNLCTCGDVEGKKVKRGRKPKITRKQLTYSSLYAWINRQLLLSMVMKVPEAHLEEYRTELNSDAVLPSHWQYSKGELDFSKKVSTLWCPPK